MIIKERLEELIKQGATIYIITQQSFIAGVSNFIDIQKEILSKENNIGKDNTLYWKDMGIAELENLFETEEDARWELEMTATRTETLKLPSWGEFKKKKQFVFISAHYTWYEISIFKKKIHWKFCLDDEYWTDYKDWEPIEATKENYIDACRLCRKLFLGEEI